MNSDLCGKNKGYSLLQTGLALSVMAALVTVSLPRMLDVVEDAKDAKVRAVGSSFKAAVYLTREAWYAAGKPKGALTTFGKGDVVMSSSGWPEKRISQSDTDNGSASGEATCRDLWRALLVDRAPEVEVSGLKKSTTEFIAEMDSGVCRYRYVGSDIERFIQYSPANGRIKWQVRYN